MTSTELDLFKCHVDTCTRIVTIGSRQFCSSHSERKRKYGTATPIINCFECQESFILIRVGKGGGERPRCDNCRYLLDTYEHLLTTRDRGNLEVRSDRYTKYGVSVIWYIKTLIAQDFTCAISGCATKHARLAQLHIDHDHNCCHDRTGENGSGKRMCGKCVRGLICPRHNGLIAGYELIMKDISALEYLSSHGGKLA
jgi:hypothetical protein